MRYAKLFLIVLLVFACSNDKTTNSINEKESHLKYFGFTLIDTYWDDPTDDNSISNYKDEVYSFSNIADILVVNPTDNIISRINAFDALNMKAMLHINELFFEIIGNNAPSGTQYALRNNYQERWNNFVATNQLQDNQSKIATFYLGEEPTHNGITFEDLQTAANLIDSQFSAIPILIIEASTAITQLQVPETIDWIGFDHYFIKNPNTNVQFQQEWNLLQQKRTNNNQKFVIVMDSHYIPEIHGTYANIELNDMAIVAQNYYDLAQSNQDVVALIGYFWPSGFDLPNATGARNMPNTVKQKYLDIGKMITGK